jgi:phage regulator Rha-like protein
MIKNEIMTENSKLVTLYNDVAFTNSMIIAIGTENKHHTIKQLIRKYKAEIEEFGTLRILNAESSGGRPTEIFLLNEEQATFMITLLRNSKNVVAFKKELVRQFYSMRQFILERQSDSWQRVREQGKITRKAETDTLSGLVEYAKKQGYDHEDKLLYMNYTKLANKICGISKRDNANMQQLSNLTVAENIILHCIQIGIEQEKHYKDIYQDCKKRLEMFKDIAYLEVA